MPAGPPSGRPFSAQGCVLTVQRQVDQDAILARVAATLRSGSPATLQMANRQGDVQHVLAFSPLNGALVAVSISELRAPLLLPPKWSQASLSLPPASAELAEALAGGENLAEFAERTGLSIGGARTRLKKLLRRLGVRSQSDLVAVLLRTAAALPVP
jgi:DNA-binding NarL/FixJ family response regulator